jgi:ABC-type sulfate transport system permease component
MIQKGYCFSFKKGVSEYGSASVIRKSTEIINFLLPDMLDRNNLYSRRQISQFVYFIS